MQVSGVRRYCGLFRTARPCFIIRLFFKEKSLILKSVRAYGNRAMGNPDFNCQNDESSSDCDVDLCDMIPLNTNPDVANVYYIMESLDRFHTCFTGLSQAFEVSAIATALSKDDWAETFYVDKEVKSITALRLVFAFLQIIIGIGAALAGMGLAVGDAIASGGIALFGGATNAAIAAIATQ